MKTIESTARTAGVLYFVMSVLAVISYLYVGPSFFVAGDPAATAGKIVGREFVYRLGLLTGFVCQLVFIFLVWALYELFRDVDRKLATLMVLLVSIGIAGSLFTLALGFAPLVILNGSDYWSVFPKSQLETLAYGFLRLKTHGNYLVTTFWGLWLFPFGLLVIKSGFLPRILGYLLLAAGVAYPVGSFTSILFPAQSQLVNRIVTPLEFGEFPIILWLLVKGAKVKGPRAGQ